MKREEAGRGSGQQETARGQCEAGGGDPQAGTDNVPIWEADGAAPPHSVPGPLWRAATSAECRSQSRTPPSCCGRKGAEGGELSIQQVSR